MSRLSSVAKLLEHSDNIPSSSVTIDFKWAENIQQDGTWSDFTLNGDAAPPDRFNFRAQLN